MESPENHTEQTIASRITVAILAAGAGGILGLLFGGVLHVAGVIMDGDGIGLRFALGLAFAVGAFGFFAGITGEFDQDESAN